MGDIARMGAIASKFCGGTARQRIQGRTHKGKNLFACLLG